MEEILTDEEIEELTYEEMVARTQTKEFRDNIEWFLNKCVEYEEFIWGEKSSSDTLQRLQVNQNHVDGKDS